MSFNLDQIRTCARTLRNTVHTMETESLVVRYTLEVLHGTHVLLAGLDTRTAARHFAHAAVLQLTLDELLRLRCAIHGELRPCRECRGLKRLRAQGEVP